MKKYNKYISIFILFIVVLMIGIFIYQKKCDYIGCIVPETNKPEESILDIKINKGKEEIEKSIIITQEIEFNNLCSSISKPLDLITIIEESQLNTDEYIYGLLQKYIDKVITKSYFENEILLKIGEIADKEAIEKRLHLNFLFIIINDIERGNTQINCNDIFKQYNK